LLLAGTAIVGVKLVDVFEHNESVGNDDE